MGRLPVWMLMRGILRAADPSSLRDQPIRQVHIARSQGCVPGCSTIEAPPHSNPTSAGGPSAGSGGRLRLHGWHAPAILATGALAAAAGFAQFGGTSALADVARSFG
jgi:hypothetical protein